MVFVYFPDKYISSFKLQAGSILNNWLNMLQK